jgi:hypothetical protein
VAAAALAVPVLFTTRTGMQEWEVVVACGLVARWLLNIFWHVFTNRTVSVR